MLSHRICHNAERSKVCVAMLLAFSMLFDSILAYSMPKLIAL